MNSAHIVATTGLTAALAHVIFWHGSGAPDIATSGDLAVLIFAALAWANARFPFLSTTKGTSDGR